MRIDRDSFREITETLLRNRGRSILTGFGVFWGIFMLMILMGGARGLKDLLMRNFQGFATNSAFVIPGRTSLPFKGFRQDRVWNLNDTDVERLRVMLPELEIVTPLNTIYDEVGYYGNQSTDVRLKGIEVSYAGIEAPELRYGRFLNDMDLQQERKVCVIGKQIYETLFTEGGDPCGKYIRIGDIWYMVVGVDWSERQVSLNGNASESAYIPATLFRRAYNVGDKVEIVCMKGHDGVSMKALEPKIINTIARNHYIDPTDKKAFNVLNLEVIFSLMNNIFIGLNILFWIIGIGTILAGAIGVSNIMMVTVKERTSEIGIRRAIGATPAMVLSQVMSESILLTLVSGFAGIVVSVFILSGADSLAVKDGVQIAEFQVGFWMAIGAALLLTVLGALAGLAPASRAVRIKPVDAMRDE